MSLARIRGDIAAAQEYFSYVEGSATPAGGLMVLVALQTSRSRLHLRRVVPRVVPERNAGGARQEAVVIAVTAQVPKRPNLLPPPVHVEPGSAQPDLRHTTRGEMAWQV